MGYEFPGIDGRVAIVTGASAYMTGQTICVDGGLVLLG